MATLADSLVSSSARAMPIRMRPDLTAKQQRYHGRSYWVVKDPVGLNYYRFQDEEWAILQMLDGKTSLDEVKERFEAEFPPQKITLEELQQFLGMLHKSGLILAGVQGQGKQLRKRRDERRHKETVGALTNILCIRFKGIDPERILNWLYPKIGWIYSPVMVFLTVLLALSALSLVLIQFDLFQSKLPSFHQFFTPKNAFFLAIILGSTKVIHEFGHGLVCKHFGGECHEMGVMILVLTPCLYCNVSDSWMLPNKWHRAAIGAAGMYIEVAIASVCTFVWWFTSPGLLHYLCLNVMFVSSVSTILFNANPLLRYDGYYILADIVEIPNLRQKATSILSRKLGLWILGIEPPEDPFLPERNQIFFAIYSIAAVCYRWFVMASILFFLYKVFEPYGLKFVGQLIAGMALYGLLVMPLVKLVKYFRVPGRIHKVKKPRMFAWLGVFILLIAAAIYFPLPYHVMSTFEIEPVGAKSIYVPVPGKLTAVSVKPGDAVAQGDTLAQLESTDLQLAIIRLVREKEQYEVTIENLNLQALQNPNAGHQIPQLQELIGKVEAQIVELERDLDRLQLRAPIAGRVMPPPRVPIQKDDTGQLPTWSGRLLDRENVGASVAASTMFCMIGDPSKLEAVLVIDQSDILFVANGHEVELKFDELPGETFRGVIDEIAANMLEVSPTGLSAKTGGDLATKTDASGMEKPLSTSYQARVLIEDPDGRFRLGLKGDAKIHVAPQTLGNRISRLVSETFNFKL